MHAVSKFALAPLRKRLAYVSIAASLCVLIGACSDDADDPSNARAATPDESAQADANPVTRSAAPFAAQPDQNPSDAPSALPALTIQTPPVSASNAAASLSAAGVEPLVTPVIHTVD